VETILTLAWLISFFAGVAGLIRPRWVRLQSRWAASVLVTSSFLFPVAAGEFFPSADVKQERGATVVVLLFWAICCGIVILCRLGVQAQRMADKGMPPEPSGFIQTNAAKWATAIISRREMPRKQPASVDQKRESSAPSEARKALGMAVHSDIARRRREAAAARPGPEARSFGSEDFYAEIGEEGEHGRIIRTGWNQGPLSFEYADYHGELSVRTIHKWVEYPQYIQGWCEDKEDTRTFRKSRVQTWFGGSETMLRGPRGRSRL
jgi:hypothetical protein